MDDDDFDGNCFSGMVPQFKPLLVAAHKQPQVVEATNGAASNETAFNPFANLKKDEQVTKQDQDETKPSDSNLNKPESGNPEIEKVLKSSLVIEPPTRSTKKREWVRKLDVNSATIDEEVFKSLIPDPAFTYPFVLDTFQKQAILCLEQHENVFVSAHTSAGKTVVAEYAMAMARRNHNKVIYTSPIKALSNQKFRDFKLTFGIKEVGILTGDVQIQPEAPCLIMTTEILLQMLYNSSEVIRDLEWVIFDEVHYCNDPERGHVWEKIFILLPDHISLVLLSATVSNIPDYAEWLGRTRQRNIYVISTAKRPVPLEHFVYVGKVASGKAAKFQFVDSSSKLNQEGYKNAMAAICDREEKRRKKFGNVGRGNSVGDRNFYIDMIRHLESDEKLPVIVFTFSRKKCDENGLMLSGSISLTDQKDKSRIHRFIDRCLGSLSNSDRQIKQVKEVSGMLKNGFGVHHSGVLPILKEITEILFTEGLVKVLFATETFAMGVNMPARSVAFDTIEKFDSFQKRNLLPSEYIQMAGRAGRRGKDTTGTVLVCCKSRLPELSELNKMALGDPPQLVSQFKLTYSMILNLLKTRHADKIESVMSKSFAENEKHSDISRLEEERKKFEQQLIESSDKIVSCPDFCDHDLNSFCELYRDSYGFYLEKSLPELMRDAFDKKFLVPGRCLLYDSASHHLFTFGILISPPKRSRNKATEVKGQPITYFYSFEVLQVDVIDLLRHGPQVVSQSTKVSIVTGDQVHLIYSLGPIGGPAKPKLPPLVDWIQVKRENEQQNQQSTNPVQSTNCDSTKSATIGLLNELLSLLAAINHEIPILNPSCLLQLPSLDAARDLKVKLSLSRSEDLDHLARFRSQLTTFICTDCPFFASHFNSHYWRFMIQKQLDFVTFKLSPESMEFLPEYKMRLKVLQQLNFVNQELCLEPKGKTACLFSEHELVLTELVFDNLIQNLTKEEIAALFSGFVFQQKDKDQKVDSETEWPSQGIKSAIESIKNIARKVATIQQSCGMVHYPIEDFVSEMHFGMVNVTFEWAGGKPFKDIVATETDIQEGIIVRTLQRLDEVISDVKDAAKMLGDDVLEAKMDSVASCIRRDIVFAASLYFSNSTEIGKIEDQEDLIGQEYE